MIKAFTVHTSEIDDVDAALSEIKEQLNLEQSGRLLKNSIGVMNCYSDFLDSGVVRALSAELPFEMVGATTLCSATADGAETMALTLTVLTSDDVDFAVGLSEPLTLSNVETALSEAYLGAAAGRGADEKPSLILSFSPLLPDVSGDPYVNATNKVAPGVPLFGMLAVDHNEDYHDSQVVRGGTAYKDRCAFVLLFGPANPKFFIASLSPEKIYRDKGVVSASQGGLLQSVNGMTTVQYLETLGHKADVNGNIQGINTFPLLVDYNDGTAPVVRAMFANTPHGAAVCGGDIPVGATLSVASVNADEIVATAAASLKAALAQYKPTCAFLFSCVGRFFFLGYEPLKEAEKVCEIIKDSGIAVHMAYSGGELCPVCGPDGKSTINRAHNTTLVICFL
ncbi:hypothetical protein AGMMS49957_09180 [Synergistales bacterium]|nr:hypothetical protein AGMMS49957_09180 [Synergistales bacterium]